MARPAAAKTEEALIAALDARLKARFDKLKGEPVPAKLKRHVDALEAAEAKTRKG
jgi:anti-sigma factor RsiW